jgi:hypothetical protein
VPWYFLGGNVKLFFYYETRSLLDDILAAVSPVRPVTLADLQIFDASTQHHVKQMERRHYDWLLPDDSEIGRTVTMTAILDRPGKYYADGAKVLLIENMPDSKIVL